MSISINEFKDWARQSPNAAVATTGMVLVSESSKLGFFARFFKTDAVDKVRGAVMKDFTRALSSRYGVSIAQQAISQAGLSSTSQLKGRTIANVISVAKRLRADMLRPVGQQDLRLGDTTIVRAQFSGLGRDGGKKLLGKFLKRRAVAVELLGEFPLSQTDYEDFQARATDLVTRLRAMKDVIIPASVPAEEFTAEVDALIQAINDKEAQMRDLLDNQPLGERNIREYKNIVYDVVVKAMESLRASAGDNAAAVVAIGRAIDQLRNNPRVRQDFDRNVSLSKDVFKVIAPFVVNLVKARLDRANVRGFKVDSSYMVSQLKAGYRQVLNERPWPLVSKTFVTSVGNRPVEMTSTIAPAAQLGHSPESPRGPIADGYPQGVHGYMCHSADSKHAVNLAVSSLTVRDSGGEPKLAFCGVRHSVHCAWEIRNDQERSAANVRRAEEAVIAAFMAKYDVPANHEALPEPGEDGTINMDMNMTSVALLTPDKTRHVLYKGSSSDERDMLMGQTAAWESVQRTGVTFRYNGRQIHIRPKLLTFNFGVNEGAVKSYGKLAPNFLGGWDRSKAMNKVAFEALTQDVMAFINDKTKDSNVKAAAFTLYNQCRSILLLRRERSDSHDAYKAAARIAVLSQLIGKVPCWNCKSGKDRTGEMDVECKFLSALIARGENIPEPGARLTDEQKGLFRAIALQSGNFEIQKMNVGVAGFKSGSVESIEERLGGKAYHAFHRGGSDHV